MARVAADIGFRLREPLLFEVEAPGAVKPPPVKSEDNRRSSVLIWFLIERASVSFDRDKSMRPSIAQTRITASEYYGN